MASAVEGSDAGRSWRDCRPKLTEAKPKHTLFGSVLEQQDKDSVEELNKIDLDGYTQSLLNHKTAGRQKAGRRSRNSAHMELNQQKDVASQINDELSHLQHKSVYFDLEKNRGDLKSDSGANSKQSNERWLSEKDLDHAADINSIGLKPRHNYNYDKYGPAQPQHQYTLIGNPLGQGMEFPTQQDPYYGAYPPSAYVGRRACRRRPHPEAESPGTSQANSRQGSALPTTNDLPPNIRHQFGTNICQNVLSDPLKVSETLEDQRRKQANLRRTRVPPSAAGSEAAEECDPQYDALGQALRQNVFPGYTYDHKNSITKSTYTSNIHDNREQDPDEFRYQRDELSTWAEQNVLRERMKKAWDSFLAETKSG